MRNLGKLESLCSLVLRRRFLIQCAILWYIPFVLEANGISFCSKTNGKLSTRAYSIKIKNKLCNKSQTGVNGIKGPQLRALLTETIRTYRHSIVLRGSREVLNWAPNERRQPLGQQMQIFPVCYGSLYYYFY